MTTEARVAPPSPRPATGATAADTAAAERHPEAHSRLPRPARRGGGAKGLQGDPARGQGVVEYGLILALVAVVCVVSLVFFGDQLSSLLSLIAEAI